MKTNVFIFFLYTVFKMPVYINLYIIYKLSNCDNLIESSTYKHCYLTEEESIMPKAIFCRNEHDPLKLLAVCKPQFMTISNVINETQRVYINENIKVEKALQQHEHFCEVLRKNGIELVEIPASAEYPEQVFTRDISFTIGSTVFISDMRHPIRKGEEQLLKTWLHQHQLPFQELTASIEGGDVILDDHTVFVGISQRTSEAAVQELSSLLEDYTIKRLPIVSSYLHLDCVLNFLSEDEVLIFSPAFAKKDVQWLADRYQLIEVTPEEQFTLGTNILSLGNKRIISLPVNRQVNTSLRERGYLVEEVDFSEIIKSGGSFRCCSMPLLREQKKYR